MTLLIMQSKLQGSQLNAEENKHFKYVKRILSQPMLFQMMIS